jgi:hypothetical protein
MTTFVFEISHGVTSRDGNLVRFRVQADTEEAAREWFVKGFKVTPPPGEAEPTYNLIGEEP